MTWEEELKVISKLKMGICRGFSKTENDVLTFTDLSGYAGSVPGALPT